MRQTVEKLRALKIHLVNILEHLTNEIDKRPNAKTFNLLYDSRAIVGTAAEGIDGVLGDIEKLVDNCG